MNKLEQVSIRMIKENSIEYSDSIKSPKEAIEVMRKFMYGLDREQFIVVTLDNQNKPINFNVVHIGTLDRSLVHPRDVFKTAILSNAKSIMLFHNHPAGSLKPSELDLEVTERLVEGGQLLGIQVVDHIIITDIGYTSIFAYLDFL